MPPVYPLLVAARVRVEEGTQESSRAEEKGSNDHVEEAVRADVGVDCEGRIGAEGDRARVGA